MKKHLYIAFLALLSTLTVFSQQTIRLTFTAIDSASYVQLDSIKVMNRTQECDTAMYHPDTSVILKYTASQPNKIRSGFYFEPGDKLLMIGYSNTHQSGIIDSATNSKTYIFQLAYAIPCPGAPTVTYEGQVYNTVQIFSQCWLKENLNVGKMISEDSSMTNNGIIEKYCYYNDPDTCNKFGGLYLWDEMMQYSYKQGTQGICPLGWHIPTDDEWKILEGAVDSKFGIGSNEWDSLYVNGYDVGKVLKTRYDWNKPIFFNQKDDGSGIGLDYYGFSALPGGIYISGGFYHYSEKKFFNKINDAGRWWTSSTFESQRDTIYNRGIHVVDSDIARYPKHRLLGMSVRCIKD